jgi:CDP-diacylglycerol--glycerol-3-phosphate 3-phosphatidyltransferase
MAQSVMNIPNSLTFLRIGLIPIFVVVFYLPFAWMNLVAAAIFGFAALTDLLDGLLARRLGQTSALGAFLDPVADKLMVAVALVLLVENDPTPWLAVPACIIIGREITISALREWMAVLGQRARVSVATMGKYKTTIQMIAILLLIYGDPFSGFLPYQLGLVLLYIAALLTLWSMFLYLRAAAVTMSPSAEATNQPSGLDTPQPGAKMERSITRE